MLTTRDLAHMLRSKRERAGLTQREAADMMGVSLRQYKRWEQGRGLRLYARFVSAVFRLDHAFLSRDCSR